jgi:NAD(P)-dependent dehydrogenase (short-subunit alcohol dehydrogenase family)
MLVEAEFSTPDGARDALKKTLALLNGNIDHLVSISGPWWSIPSIRDMKPEMWREVTAANLEPHVYVYNVFAKHVKLSYQIVNGAAKDMLPRSGITGVMANAVDGFARVAVEETRKTSGPDGLRLYNVVLSSSVGHSDSRSSSHEPAAYGHSFVAIASTAPKGKDQWNN